MGGPVLSDIFDHKRNTNNPELFYETAVRGEVRTF